MRKRAFEEQFYLLDSVKIKIMLCLEVKAKLGFAILISL